MTAPLPPVISSKATEEFPRCCNIRDKKVKKNKNNDGEKKPQKKDKRNKTKSSIKSNF